MIFLYFFNFNRDLGRNCYGVIVNRFKCNYLNNKYYVIDNYFFNKNNSIFNTSFFVYKVISNIFFRNSFLIKCLNFYSGGKYARIFIKPFKVNKGDIINLLNNSTLNYGDSSYIFNFYYGNNIFNIENYKDRRSTYCRSFLSYSTILCFNSNYYFVKLPSGNVIKIYRMSKVFLGKPDGLNINYHFKAGKSRIFGIRPKVRGKAMNVVDHPHGGGTGKTSIGRKSIYSIYGKMLKGVKTSRRK